MRRSEEDCDTLSSWAARQRDHTGSAAAKPLQPIDDSKRQAYIQSQYDFAQKCARERYHRLPRADKVAWQEQLLNRQLTEF